MLSNEPKTNKPNVGNSTPGGAVAASRQQPNGLSELSFWVRHRSVAYFTGRGIFFGAEAELFPRNAIAPGKFPVYVDALPNPVLSVCEDNLAVCADNAWDYVFVGPRLGQLIRQPKELLNEASRKLLVGGHLVVFLPINASEHTHRFTHNSLKELLESVGSWKLKDSYERDGHLLHIYKKLPGNKGIVERTKTTKPRACIVRYGALGDMIMVTPLIKQLALDGYDVTLNISPYSKDIIKNNPYVHNLILQERDAIPNPTLGRYWNEWSKDYDRYINLSESIEGALLKVEGRREFYTSQSWRHDRCNTNYYDYTMKLGGYPNVLGARGELFFSRGEEKDALWIRGKHKNKFFVVWALNGSSHHKKYGLLKPVLTDWLASHPNVVVVTVGDARAKEHEFAHPQIVNAAAAWPIRTSLALTKIADLVVGPESVMVNAAGCFATPKLTMLSHSSHENLCKYWDNDYCIAPDPSISPCYGCSGCHQLHYSLESCPLSEVRDADTNEVLASGPSCAMGAITGERLIARLNEVYSLHSSLP